MTSPSLSPAVADRLVRQVLGLRAAGKSLAEDAASARRALLTTDSFQAGEDVRLRQALAARDASRDRTAAPQHSPDPQQPKVVSR